MADRERRSREFEFNYLNRKTAAVELKLDRYSTCDKPPSDWRPAFSKAGRLER